VPDLSKELESLILLYGKSIPPIPKQHRLAQRTVRWDTELDVFAQRVANIREYGYDGKVETLARHAVSLFLLAIAAVDKLDATPIKFQMEVLRREREDEDYTAFAEYAQATIREAGEHMTTITGKHRAGQMLRVVVGTVAKQPSQVVRLRMQSYLTTDRRFVKMIKELGDEALKSWLELAS
jgi:hypothetical protein